MSSFRLNELERHPAKPRRGSGAGGRNQTALARLHSVGSLNRSHDFTAEGGGSFAAPTGHALSVAEAYPAWKLLVEHWDELTALYLEELPTGRCPKLYDRMQELRKA